MMIHGKQRCRIDWKQAFSGAAICLLAGALALSAGCSSKEEGSSLADQYTAAMKIPGDEARARKLAAIGEDQLKAKDYAGAERSFAAAREAAAELDDPMQAAGVYLTLAVKQAKSNSKNGSRQAVEQAAGKINQIEIAEAKAENLADLGILQARFVDKDVAVATIQSAEEMIDQVEGIEGKVNVLSKVTRAYRAIQNNDEAERVLVSAVDMANEIEAPSEKIRALIAVAHAQNKAGYKKAALATLGEAVTVAGTINDDVTLAALRRLDIAEAYGDLGEKDLRQKQIDKAHDLATGPNAGSTAQEALDRIGRMGS